IPDWIRINSIDLSPHEKGAAYVAATMYQFDDFRPYLYKTTDYGKTWTKIVRGIPDNAFTCVVREDPSRRGLLYAGTELGLFISVGRGASWQPFQQNPPVVPITDLTVKAKDLVIATQGRAFWVLDDLTPIHEYRDAIRSEAVHLFPPRPTIRYGRSGFGGGEEEETIATSGKNPPNGVLGAYFLRPKAGEKDKLTSEIIDGKKVSGSYSREKKEREGGAESGEDERGDKPIEAKEGLNRLVWDLQIVRPTLVPKAIIWGSSQGPR